MKKLISFSIYGNDPKYIQGAIENAKMKNDNFSDWTLRFYIQSDVPNIEELVQSLRFYGSEIVIRDDIGMSSRFEAVSDGTADIVIVRDTDSRLTNRDGFMVSQWLENGSPVHIIRDHPSHRSLVMGGMFGIRSGEVSEMFGREFVAFKNAINQRTPGWDWKRDYDQRFLNAAIFPKVKDIAFTQDEYFRPNGNEQPYGIERIDATDFIGNVYASNNNPECSIPLDRMNG